MSDYVSLSFSVFVSQLKTAVIHYIVQMGRQKALDTLTDTQTMPIAHGWLWHKNTTGYSQFSKGLLQKRTLTYCLSTMGSQVLETYEPGEQCNFSLTVKGVSYKGLQLNYFTFILLENYTYMLWVCQKNKLIKQCLCINVNGETRDI